VSKLLSVGVASIFGVLALCHSALAQPALPGAGPTTKILAIGTLTPGSDPRKALEIIGTEVRATAQLYLDGKIDQWFSLQDRNGVAFILNVTDPKEAEDMLDKLPLGQAGLMKFELIRLGPLKPLRQLLGPSAGK
jgi:hypothetical protein